MGLSSTGKMLCKELAFTQFCYILFSQYMKLHSVKNKYSTITCVLYNDMLTETYFYV